MLTYLIPLSLLSFLSFFEITYKFQNILKSHKFYFLLFFVFVLFIGFRDNIGCDWDGYKIIFKNISSTPIIDIFRSKSIFYDIGYIFITKIVSLKFNFYINNLVISSIFTGSLFYFCSKLKRTYLALMISYPYYFLVIGMGPIRQSLAISFVMLAILFVYLKNIRGYFFSAIISSTFHHSAIFVNALFFTLLSFFSRKSGKYILLSFYLIILILFILGKDFILTRILFYFNEYGIQVNPSRGVIFVWLINFLPSIIFLTNISKFKFNSDIKNLLFYYSFFEIILLPFIYINSTVTYRLLLYLFPNSIFITSHIPDINLFNLNEKKSYFYLIIFSFLSLLIWLKYAYHSYCWLPYQNIIL
tara:strand:+ start:1662 stop:2738 length:1077 start_codon:yes stop_codon:yes gene_type:complete